MGEIHLEWNDHDKDLSTKLWEFFEEEYLVDFCVACHGQQMKVHKFILAFLFPMFKESLGSKGTFSFEKEQSKDDNHCLNLDNIADHPEDMNYLFQYAYTGKTTIPKEHTDCLMRIAKTMEIKSLKNSLGQWHDNSKPAEKPELNDMPRLRLRPRIHLKVLNESVGSDNDFDSDEELSVESSEGLNVSTSGSDEAKRITKSREKKTKQTRKRRGKEKEKSTKTPQKLSRTDADEKKDQGTPSQEQTSETTLRNVTINEKKGLKCPHCDFLSKYPSQLERHLSSHVRRKLKGPKLFTCKICKKGFDRKNLLNVHRDSKCGTEPLMCKYCGHQSNKKPALMQHIMSKHQVDVDGNPLEKNVKCSDCDFVCYAKHQLRVHSRSKHERLGMFKCTNCSYTAPYINQLERHDRVMHQNIRDFMCDECGFRFQNKHKLNHHILVHHKGVKPHKCNVCSAEYSDKLSFKIHMQRHEGNVQYRFVCHMCGHNLRKKYELRIHMRKKHGTELEEGLATTDPSQLQDACEPTS